jgi:hypothetical protein
MSRSGYSDDCDDDWSLIRWRGAVASAIRGKRGQAFLRELLNALDALPEKKLIAHRLERNGSYCALGAIGAARGLDLKALDAPYDCAPEDVEYIEEVDHGKFVETFGVAGALLREIQYMNDEAPWAHESPEARWARVRAWVVEQLKLKEVPKA